MILRILIMGFFMTVAGLAQQTVYVPQIGHGDGFETTLSFINLSGTTSRAEVRAYTDNGTPLNLLLRAASPFEDAQAVSEMGLETAPLGYGALSTYSFNPSVQVGWAEITTEDSVAVEVVFSRYAASRQLLTSTSVLPGPLTTEFSFIAFANPVARSGLALLNPPDAVATANVALRLFDRFGFLVGERVVPLAPGRKISRFVDEAELFPGLEGQDFSGTVEVRSDVPVAVMPLRVQGIHITTQLVHSHREVD